MFRPGSMHVLIVLIVYFSRIRDIFRTSSRIFSTELEVSSDHSQSMFRVCSKYIRPGLRFISTLLEFCFDGA